MANTGPRKAECALSVIQRSRCRGNLTLKSNVNRSMRWRVFKHSLLRKHRHTATWQRQKKHKGAKSGKKKIDPFLFLPYLMLSQRVKFPIDFRTLMKMKNRGRQAILHLAIFRQSQFQLFVSKTTTPKLGCSHSEPRNTLCRDACVFIRCLERSKESRWTLFWRHVDHVIGVW